MSLTDKLAEGSKFTGKSLVEVLKATAFMNCEMPQADTFSKSVTQKTMFLTVPYLSLGIVLSHEYGLAGLGTLIGGSILYRTGKWVKDKVSGKKKEEETEEKVPFLQGLKRAFGFKRIASSATAFALASSLAIADYNLREVPKVYDANTLNVVAREYSLDGQKFYMLGETHIYNHSSSEYVDRLIKSEGIDSLLSEGIDRGDVTLKEAVLSMALITPVTALSLGARMDSRNASQVARDNGIPVEVIETVDEETGVREGLSTPTAAVLIGVGAFATLRAPGLYFFSMPFSYNSYFLGEITNGSVNSVLDKTDIIGDRNRAMAENVVEYLRDNPDKIPLVRVGSAHMSGMERALEAYGSLGVKEMK